MDGGKILRTIGCIIARTKSQRLPQKVLSEINGIKMIEHIIETIKRVRNLDGIYLCTTTDKEDQVLLDIANQQGIKGFAGDREAVIERMLKVAEIEKADHVVRITGDNIFTNGIFLEMMIQIHKQNKMEYTRTEYLPLGVTAEVMAVDALKRCSCSIDPNKSEYLLLYMFDPIQYNCQVLIPPVSLQKPFSSLTVDTLEDVHRTKFIFEHISKVEPIYLEDIYELNCRKGIKNFEIQKNMLIKMPGDTTMTYGDFRKLMKERIEKSRKIMINWNHYEKYKHV